MSTRGPKARAAGGRPTRVLWVYDHAERLVRFESAIQALAERGHEVVVAVGRDKPADGGSGGRAITKRLTREHPSVTTIASPVLRETVWGALAHDARMGLDYLRYVGPDYAEAHHLRERWAARTPDDHVALAHGGRARRRLGAAGLRIVARLDAPQPAVVAWLATQAPDVVALTPMVSDGKHQQAQFALAAQALGLPVCACINSWDNLTNKGLLHGRPDRVLVWNRAQGEEAAALHGVPARRIAVTGAPHFDRWFERMDREDPATFRRRARAATAKRHGLDDRDRALVTYVGSSQQIAPDEAEGARAWVAALRAHPDARLAGAWVVLRPHPFNQRGWGVPDDPLTRCVARPDLPDDPESAGALLDLLAGSDAVVGINTTALIDAAVVDVPTLSFAQGHEDGQAQTLHFEHLVPERGGPLQLAASRAEHLDELATVLSGADPAADRRRRFVDEFVRPLGRDVTPGVVVAQELHDLARLRRRRPRWAAGRRSALRGLALPIVAGRLDAVLDEAVTRGVAARTKLARHPYEAEVELSDPAAPPTPR